MVPLAARPPRRSNEPSPRYALYWVPPREHPLWVAGNAWLGRNPEMTDGGVPPDHAAQPWHYGFHATLKAPFRLRAGVDPKGLFHEIVRLARTSADFAMPPLQVGWLDGFLALRPAASLHAGHPLWRLADRCVTQLDLWRAPPDALERRRRERQAVSREHKLMLDSWGYPHVLAQWRFHLTLSDADPPDASGLQQRAERHFAVALGQPLRAGGVALFAQLRADGPFVLLRRFAFGA
ncbi:MAG: DUF1045 domain-containing protein [Burkholderiaceae bacterium]|nr:DUF1045 domain-containing protein [Burkholderiaceae bacterium]